ncbi:MAG: GNAT family N-acetyltransferase [Fibrobacteria bacterium]|nr:GNAT family N-acetyltransferase [Fibrobacteria bacterium]
MEAVPYTAEHLDTWNTLVEGARNGHFQWNRGFMDYHSDRFRDRSFLFRDRDKWLGAVAGHDWENDGWATHRGLTFGGFILDPHARTPDVQGMFDALHSRLRDLGKTRVRWRPLPWFHQREPSQEDLYFLFRLGATTVSRTLGTLVDPFHLRVSATRRRACAKVQREGLRVERRHDWDRFWSMLERTLSDRHATRPVHSLDEIRLLAGRFPDHIQLFGAIQGETWLGGMVVFRVPEVFHIQYIAATDEGRAREAAPLLALELGTQHARGSSRWLSFGNSCERSGLVLNEGLVAFKEAFGGHGAVYEEFEYRIPEGSL